VFSRGDLPLADIKSPDSAWQDKIARRLKELQQ
jgi:hypothetical protein